MHVLSMGSFQSNCTLAQMVDLGKIFIVDPGAEAARIQEAMAHYKSPPDFIWLTHAHLDHIGAVEEIYHAYKQPEIFLHEQEQPLYENVALQCQMFGAPLFTVPERTSKTFPGQKLFDDDIKCEILHVPGHSPGSCVLYLEGDIHVAGDKNLGIRDSHNCQRVLVAGDTLFRGSIGRTDLWQGNHDLLISGIKQKLFTLPEDTVVIPGHGPLTTIGRERQSNPFLQGE